MHFCSVPASATRQQFLLASRVIVSVFGLFLLSMNFAGCAGGAASNGQVPMPSIVSFIANPPAVVPGDSATLNWNVKNASGLSITADVGGPITASNSVTVSSTSVAVKPAATTTYTLTATNSAGQNVTAIVTVGVGVLPVLNHLTASKPAIAPGDISTLSWDGTNLAGVIIDNGVGSITGNSVDVSPLATTTYTVTPVNAVGLLGIPQFITVNVVSPPAIVKFQAAPSTINLSQGGSVLSWIVSGATSLSIDNGVGTVTGSTGSVAVNPLTTTTYTLTAKNVAGSVTATSSFQTTVTVTTIPQPVIKSFTADHASVGSGGSVMLTALFDTGPGGGTANVVPAPGAIGNNQPTSSGPISSSTTFALTVTNGTNNRSASSQFRVVAGNLSAFAGKASSRGQCDDVGTGGRFNGIGGLGLAVDTHGNVYAADAGNDVICKITPTGTASTLAGIAGVPGNVEGSGGINCATAGQPQAGCAQFNAPTGLAVDNFGNVFVADSGNSTIRKIAPDGTVSTIAGTPGSHGSQDGPACADPLQGCAQFDGPQGVALTLDSNNQDLIYVADSSNNLIRKITTLDGIHWTVSTFAGTAAAPNALNSGNTDAVGPAASFYGPADLTVDSSGNVYVADLNNNTIREITPAGAVFTIAGKAGAAGKIDGTGTSARFNSPSGIAVDPSGNVYVADSANYAIRRITPTPTGFTVSTIVGTLGQFNFGFANSQPLPGMITTTNRVALDPGNGGSLYVSILSGVYKSPF